MISVIASENPVAATRLRKALAARGYECPVSHVIPLEMGEAGGQILSQKVDLLLVVLPVDASRGIRVIQQLRIKTQGRIVAMGSANDARRILDMLRAGADDYIDEDADTVHQLTASLERLALQSSAGSKAGTIIAVTATNGGCGCSMLATNLATLLARKHETCGLIDVASCHGDLAAMLNLEPRHTIAELCRHEETLDAEMVSQSMTSHESGIRLIASPNTEEDTEVITSSAMQRVLQVTRRQFTRTVIDLGTAFALRSSLLRVLDTVIVPFRLDFTSLCSTRRMVDEWERKQFDLNRLLLVGNRTNQPGELPRDKVVTILGRAVQAWFPEDPLTANLSVNCGVPIVVESPRSPIALALSQFVDQKLSNGSTPQLQTAEGEQKRDLWARLRAIPRMAGMVF